MTENQTGAVGGTAEQEGVVRQARQAAGDVVGTGREQAGQVVQEAVGQAKGAAHDMRRRVAEQAEQQAQRVAHQLTRIADELNGMAENQSEQSMTAPVIRQVADAGRQAADFLDQRGARGMLDSVQDFARRKPGTFLLGAAVAGFLVGRVAKGASGAAQGQDDAQHRSADVPQAAASRVTAPPPRSGEEFPAPVPTATGYPAETGSGYQGAAGTGYPAQTGTGYPGQTGTGYPAETGSGYPDVAGTGYPRGTGAGYQGVPGEAGGGPHVGR